jgi:hypothetical protein
MTVSIDYGDPGVVTLTDQIHIVPRPPWPGVDYEVSRGGDSGSVWLNEGNNRAIGLHFAGETNPAPTAEHAVCSPIGAIATELNFSFEPVLCPIVPPRPWRPIFDICDRYPWLCEGLFDWPRIPIPRPDPPFDLPFDDLGGLVRLLGLRGRQSAGQGGCNCGGASGGDDATLARLAAMIAAHLQQGPSR